MSIYWPIWRNQYRLFTQSDISDSQRDKLKAFGKEIVERRTEQFLVQNNKKKIYPNEPSIVFQSLYAVKNSL